MRAERVDTRWSKGIAAGDRGPGGRKYRMVLGGCVGNNH